MLYSAYGLLGRKRFIVKRIFLLIFCVLMGSGFALAQDEDPYDGLTIDELAARSYGGGTLQIHETMATTANFTRYLVSYPSDEFTVYGFMNVPHGDGPFPVVIAVHGYVNPSAYGTLDYTTRYADDLANAGFLVLHPNLRGYSPSNGQSDPNYFRVGYAIDVLNLVGLVRGQAGALAAANGEQIGLWGHSMGGGIAVRVITVDPDIDAAILYGAMSGNETLNAEAIREWSGGASGSFELETPPIELLAISPIYHVDRVGAAVSIHHGALDATVPPTWSTDLCTELQTLGKAVECFNYEGQPHTFNGTSDRLFMDRAAAFFAAHLGSHE
jgi:dienelactone hydrolase